MEPAASNSFPAMRRNLWVILACVLFIFTLHLSPLRQYRESALLFCEEINRYGALAPFIFIFSSAVLVSIGIPRLLLCTAGGMLFGFYQGLMYTVTGTILGYCVVFSTVRWVGRDFIISRYPGINRFTKFLKYGGIPGVILARQIPLHGMIINIILGLSPVKQSEFLVGTAIGLFPEAIPFTLIGTGVKQASLEKSMTCLGMAVVLFALLWMGLKIWSEKEKVRQKWSV